MLKESMNAGTEAMEYFTDYFSQFQKVMIHQQMTAPPHFYPQAPRLPSLPHNPYQMLGNHKASMLDVPGSFMAPPPLPQPLPHSLPQFPSAINPLSSPGNPMLHNPFQLQRGSVRQSRKDMFPAFPPLPPMAAQPLPRLPQPQSVPSMARPPHYPTMYPSGANPMNMSKIFDVAPPKVYGEHGLYDTPSSLQKMFSSNAKPFQMRSGSKPNRLSHFYELDPDDVSDFKRFLLEQYMMEKKKRLKEAFNSYMATMPRRGGHSNEFWPNLMTDSGLFGGGVSEDNELDYMEHKLAKNLLRCKTGAMGNKRRYIKF